MALKLYRAPLAGRAVAVGQWEYCGGDGVARRELVPSTAMAAPGAEAAAAAGAANGKGGGREWNEGAGRERANTGMLKALSGSAWPDRA